MNLFCSEKLTQEPEKLCSSEILIILYTGNQ